MTPTLSIQKWECLHDKSNPPRKLKQIQNNIQHEIICCDPCADIALKSPGDFTEDKKEFQS